MKPTFVIVGRPNVGKSTLFNRLTRTRDAIVAEVAGLTRDRHYGRGTAGGRAFVVVDTGGIQPDSTEGVFQEMARQAQLAMLKRYDPKEKKLRGLDLPAESVNGAGPGSPFYWAGFVLSGDWR